MVGTGEATDTKHLGSTLMATMIREAAQFCHPCIEEDRDYHQVTKLVTVNPLTTDDECTCHATLVACYQLVETVLKICFVLAKKVG